MERWLFHAVYLFNEADYHALGLIKVHFIARYIPLDKFMQNALLGTLWITMYNTKPMHIIVRIWSSPW